MSRGESLWRQGEETSPFRHVQALMANAPIQQSPSDSALDAIRAYLTQQPHVLWTAGRESLAFARATLDEAAQTYAQGNRDEARRLAIAAYLEGFELIESAMSNVDAPLHAETEREMMALRTATDEGAPSKAVTAQVTKLTALLDRAAESLSGNRLSPDTAFMSSLVILLREGLESILIISTIVAFVIRTDRRDALPYIHLG